MVLKKYIVVEWPESQELELWDDFREHSYPILDEMGLLKFNWPAYFVELNYYRDNI